MSWLPSFSVEVTHTNLLPGQQAHATQTSQLDNMAREVRQPSQVQRKKYYVCTVSVLTNVFISLCTSAIIVIIGPILDDKLKEKFLKP